MVDLITSAISAVLTLAFSLATFDRYLETKRKYSLYWSASMLLASIASIALGLGSDGGFNQINFKIFYFAGAINCVPLLALGNLMLLSNGKITTLAEKAVMGFFLLSLGAIIQSPYHLANPTTLPQGIRAFDAFIPALAGIGSGLGAVTIFLITGFSVIKNIKRNNSRALGNILILLGTVVLSLSGILNSVLDAMSSFAITLSVGFAVLFVGYLVVRSTD